MPYCANCGWSYAGAPRFCRECGRPIRRRAAAAALAPELERQSTVSPTAALPAAWGWRPRAALFALAVLGGIAMLLTGFATSTAAMTGFPLDEPWVRLVYARNLANEGRLEFNAGQAEAGVGSVLWIATMAVLIKSLGGLGLSVVAIAKTISLLAGATAALLTAELARHLTRSRLLALGAGALVALDPTFGYAAVAGLETTLFAAMALGGLLAYLTNRMLLAGVLLGLAVLTRMEGLLLVGLVGAVHAVGLIGQSSQGRPGRSTDPAPRPADLAALLGPALLAGLIWLRLDTLTEGALPQPIEVARAVRPGVPLPDVAALWSGYLEPSVAYLAGPVALFGAPLILLGSFGLWRLGGRRALPVALFPLLFALAIAALVPLERTPWPHGTRRLLDPLLPFLALAFVVGLNAVWEAGREAWQQRFGADRVGPAPARPALWAAVVALVPLLSAAAVLGSLGSRWAQAPDEYARSSVRFSETYFEAALHLRDHIPETTLIAAVEPGALRYVSRRPIADLRGIHTPRLAGRSVLDALAEARAEFAVLPRTVLFESYPAATLLEGFVPTAAAGGEPAAIGLFRVAPGVTTSPPERPYAVPIGALRGLDYVDVGDEASETSHDYAVQDPVATVRHASRVTAQASVSDLGRTFSRSESVTLAAEPGADLILVRRFDGQSPGVFRVSADGQPVGEWSPRGGRYTLAEDSFRVPGPLVRAPRVVIRLELIAGSSRQVTSYAYWSFAE